MPGGKEPDIRPRNDARRVNGAPVFARGGNKVPMDLMDGRRTAGAEHRLVQSAVEGNMNTLRVWGGGVWEPRAFFDAADELARPAPFAPRSLPRAHSIAAAGALKSRLWATPAGNGPNVRPEYLSQGVLLYTDMQFTWGYIVGTASERAEMDYQIKRLSHHPSIAMWDGCNECGGGGLYESFVMPTVASLDRSRPIWPSCPAPGAIQPKPFSRLVLC